MVIDSSMIATHFSSMEEKKKRKKKGKEGPIN